MYIHNNIITSTYCIRYNMCVLEMFSSLLRGCTHMYNIYYIYYTFILLSLLYIRSGISVCDFFKYLPVPPICETFPRPLFFVLLGVVH